MSKLGVKFDDGKLVFGVDANQDGENSLTARLHMSEAISEMIAKGGKIEGAKVVDFSFSGTKLKLKLDTDKDGEEMFDLELDLAESFDEVTSFAAKK